MKKQKFSDPISLPSIDTETTLRFAVEHLQSGDVDVFKITALRLRGGHRSEERRNIYVVAELSPAKPGKSFTLDPVQWQWTRPIVGVGMRMVSLRPMDVGFWLCRPPEGSIAENALRELRQALKIEINKLYPV